MLILTSKRSVTPNMIPQFTAGINVSIRRVPVQRTEIPPNKRTVTRVMRGSARGTDTEHLPNYCRCTTGGSFRVKAGLDSLRQNLAMNDSIWLASRMKSMVV